ncbi:hypothetical protein [Rhodopseudomonas sp.]|uniref:hypothetical protein n=1 Tax=Rhodopseudomonas sp. TaxID=1078 RepID=UPI0039E52BBB
MDQISIATKEELERVIARFGDGYLFRGQIAHYGTESEPSVVTSFNRKGCNPAEMVKWARYAGNVLDAYIGDVTGDRLELNQALLQHYGWRSFYIDCSSEAAVAAWFASHKYSEQSMFELCEDCDERPIILKKRMARYDFFDGIGHLYVLDKERSRNLVGLTDLADLTIEKARPRTKAQSAWLLGPLSKDALPHECFVAHISGSCALMRDFAADGGFTETGCLFPSRREDPILGALLGLPWRKIELVGEGETNAIGISFFRRALDLPEYHDSFVKISPSATAFYQGARVAALGSIEGGRYGGIVISVPDVSVFGKASPASRQFPKVMELLAEHRSVAFEIDDLIQHATMRGMVLYQKGIAVTAHEPDLIELCELMVEHPGLSLTRAGLIRGWFYRVGHDGMWRREAHPDECDCRSERAHEPHLSALHIIEEYLTHPDSFS